MSYMGNILVKHLFFPAGDQSRLGLEVDPEEQSTSLIINFFLMCYVHFKPFESVYFLSVYLLRATQIS